MKKLSIVLSDKCTICILYLPDIYITCVRYYTDQYLYDIYTTCIRYVPDIILPDICVICARYL